VKLRLASEVALRRIGSYPRCSSYMSLPKQQPGKKLAYSRDVSNQGPTAEREARVQVSGFRNSTWGSLDVVFLVVWMINPDGVHD